MSERTLSELEQEIDALTDEIERAEDRGVTVMPDKRDKLAGLRKLLEAKRRAGTDEEH